MRSAIIKRPPRLPSDHSRQRSQTEIATVEVSISPLDFGPGSEGFHRHIRLPQWLVKTSHVQAPFRLSKSTRQVKKVWRPVCLFTLAWWRSGSMICVAVRGYLRITVKPKKHTIPWTPQPLTTQLTTVTEQPRQKTGVEREIYRKMYLEGER